MSEEKNDMNHLHSLSWVFERKLYRIPDYQRGYSWGLEQLDDFWNDLRFLDEDRNHYTGLLSVKPIDKNLLDGYQAYEVVDGQQRLTTCIILLNELLREAELLCPEKPAIGLKSVQDIKSEYIVRNRWNDDTNPVLLFDYDEDDNDTSVYFRCRILGVGGAIESKESLYTRNLDKAREFFVEKITELLKSDGTGNNHVLESVFIKLTKHLTFNFFIIPDNNEVYEVFESMNNRGKPLSHLEILKNRLLYLTTLYNSSQLPEKRANELHDNIVATWKSVYEWLGKNPDKPLSDNALLRDHWIIRFEYVRRNGEDYFQFLQNEFSKQAVFKHKRRYVLGQPEYDPEYAEGAGKNKPIPHDEYLEPIEIERYVDSLKEITPYWYYSYYPEEYDYLDEEEKCWLRKLNEIEISYFRPLITIAIMRRENISKEQRLRLFKAVERFIFIVFRMCNYRYDYQSSEYRKEAYYLYNNLSSIDHISEKLERLTEQLKNSAIDWFDHNVDDMFETKEGFYSWGAIRYFLLEYEFDLSRKKKYHVDKLLRGKISIEHIYPQTPADEYWSSLYAQYDEKEKKCLVGSLGNLLPLELGTNSGLQNKEFQEKKKTYFEGGYSEHEVAENNDWGPREIYKRGMVMLEFMSARWKLDLTEDMKKKLLHIEFIHHDSENSETI